MNRGSDSANQSHQLINGCTNARQERCLVGVLALATGVGSP